MEQLVIGKYPADSFCLWDGDELIARTAIFIFSSPEDMLLQLKIALIAYKRGNHLPYLYVNTGIKLLLKHIYKYKPIFYSKNDLKLIKIEYKNVNNNNICELKGIKYKSKTKIYTEITRNGDLITRTVFSPFCFEDDDDDIDDTKPKKIDWTNHSDIPLRGRRPPRQLNQA